MKKLLKAMAIFVLICTLFGCKLNNDKKDSGTQNKNEAVRIENIDWAVEPGIVKGKRVLIFKYSNNSDCTISHFEIKFKEKESITEEQKEKYIKDLIKLFDIDENDKKDKEGLEELKAKDIEMSADLEKIVKPGETATGKKVTYYDGFYCVESMTHYELVEPDIATIVYIKDGSIYTEYYDFSSEKYSLDSNVELAKYRSTGTFSEEIPAPEAEIVKCVIDDEDGFAFTVFGWTIENFNSYVESCKAMGYTLNSTQNEDVYTADNEKGYNVYLYYNEDSFSSDIAVRASENDE